MIYLVHYNHDYNETMRSHLSLEDLLKCVRDNFYIDVQVSDPGFAEEIELTYDNGDWKGFTVHVLDPQTATLLEVDISKAVAAIRSNHARIEFEGDLKKGLAKLAEAESA